ncbi:MAG: metallophosphoesterase family protein [Acidobacteria bacterium]|nr:metallophosphoesterase family protein [Acidobacteriota bacterium]
MVFSRVAALYDIHGNLPALEAVLAELRNQHVERVVIGGDVFPGPMSREAFARVCEPGFPAEYIYGNCEVALLAAREGRDPGRMPEQAKESIRWCAQQISAADEQALRGWPRTMIMQIQGLGQVLFCHGTPRNENEIFTRLTPQEAVAKALAGVQAQVIVCGHTHMQFDRVIGNTRVVNAGSVGMPFGAAGADWLLLGPDVELRHTTYDLQRAARDVRLTHYPQAEEFASRYVLNPPAEAEMLALFTEHGLK